MGKAGRCACIFLPYVLGVGALVCLILVMCGQRFNTDTLQDIFFFEMDASNLKTKIDNSDLKTLAEALNKNIGNIYDYYTVGLWNSCHGSLKNGTRELTGCSAHHAKYWFDPKTEFDLGDISTDKLYPSSLKDALETYKKASAGLYYVFMVAFVTTCVQIVAGIGGIFSRWGSFFTTLVSLISGATTIGFAIYITVMFPIVTGEFNKKLKDLDVTASDGKRVLAVAWIAAAFSLFSFIFWFFSICCCSGRSPYGHKGNKSASMAEKAPYTYERVGPLGGGHHNNVSQSAVPLTSMPAQPGLNTAYEPYRHA